MMGESGDRPSGARNPAGDSGEASPGGGTPDGPRRLALGPGRHQRELGAVLCALGAPEPHLVTDVAELLELPPDVDRVVLDSDELPAEDVGILRRFVARRTAEVVMMGLDSRARTARKLLALAGTAWMAWPPDLDQLRALIETPARPGPAAPPRPSADVAAPPEPEPAPHADSAAEPPPSGGASAPPLAPLAAPEPGARAPEPPRPVPPALDRFEQAFERLRSAVDAPGDPDDPARPAIEACAEELRHVIAWSRRGARGGGSSAEKNGLERLDLGELLEEVLAGVAVGGGDAPRFLYRSNGDLQVVSRRMQLAAGLEALFRAARTCADSGTVIQVHAERQGSADDGRLRLTVNFPAGLLDQEEVRRVLDGGGVPADLAGIDALTELSRAAGFLHGLEAGLQLEADPFNRLIVEVQLRAAALAADAGSEPPPAGPGRLEPASSELDPFA